MRMVILEASAEELKTTRTLSDLLFDLIQNITHPNVEPQEEGTEDETD